MLGSWVQQHLFVLSFTESASTYLWHVEESPPWKHYDFSASSNTSARAPHASLSFLPLLPGSEETLQNILLILRAVLVGVKSRIYCSILQVARWNPRETRQPHMASQCRTGNGSQAPTMLLDYGGWYVGVPASWTAELCYEILDRFLCLFGSQFPHL